MLSAFGDDDNDNGGSRNDFILLLHCDIFLWFVSLCHNSFNLPRSSHSRKMLERGMKGVKQLRTLSWCERFFRYTLNLDNVRLAGSILIFKCSFTCGCYDSVFMQNNEIWKTEWKMARSISFQRNGCSSSTDTVVENVCSFFSNIHIFPIYVFLLLLYISSIKIRFKNQIYSQYIHLWITTFGFTALKVCQ